MYFYEFQLFQDCKNLFWKRKQDVDSLTSSESERNSLLFASGTASLTPSWLSNIIFLDVCFHQASLFLEHCMLKIVSLSLRTWRNMYFPDPLSGFVPWFYVFSHGRLKECNCPLLEFFLSCLSLTMTPWEEWPCLSHYFVQLDEQIQFFW